MNNELWKQIIALKPADDMHKGVANTLNEDDWTTIIATAEYFDADHDELQQIYFDLAIPRYRVFDWLAMGVMSAGENGRIPTKPLKVFIHSFLKVGGVTSEFIQDLRETDYDMDTSWEKINLEDDK
jgi:hypothetical protein